MFMKLSDYTNSIETVIFPKILSRYNGIIREGNCVAIRGKMSHRNNEPSIIVEEMKELVN